MRQYNQAVLERTRDFNESFQTEPHEVAWASEATFYIKVLSVEGQDAGLDAKVQMSADGLDWVDEGSAFKTLSQPGTRFIRVKHFGGWLRLSCAIGGKDARFKVTIHLILKE